MGYLLIPLIALFGFFALKDNPPGPQSRAPRPSPLPPPGPFTSSTFNVPPSGSPAIEQEFQYATAALLQAYAVNGGCMGFTQAIVQRFQLALNAYYRAMGQPAPLAVDGVYDAPTDGFVRELAGQGFPACALTFEQAPAPGSVVYASSAPAPSGGGIVQQTPAPAPAPIDPSYYGSDPSFKSPTAGRLSYAGRT